ncbi:carboxypeptidase M32 [Cytobacillus sp. FJAT-53684]|uniref:Metal-dependent carboxypeptidase n=1 Tax=Cytobacillus mangrovibacter TaxID=3299024 RepID=A0ABW6JT70_9BACI
MGFQEKLQSIKNLMRDYKYYEALSSLFTWEQWQQLPTEGNDYRQKMQGFFTGKMGEIFLSDTAKQGAIYFSDFDPSLLGDDMERGLVRSFLYLYNNTTKVPLEKQVELASLTAKAQKMWQEAYQASDYSIFKPALEEIFRLKMGIAKYIDPNKHPFYVLAGSADEGIEIEKVNLLFKELRNGIIKILEKINKSSVNIDDSCILQQFDKEELKTFIKYLVEATGYDSSRGGFGEVLHPFAVLIGPRDVRITTNYDTFKFGVFAAIHEAGHAMYAQRSNDAVVDMHLWGGNMGAFHESQSRFYENIIGKSKEYWLHFYPELQKRFAQFENVDLDTFYKAINKVEPSFKRVVADELTYSLHPILRFEIEKDLVEGNANFNMLPELWNDKYETYLGIRPTNDREGVLQDVHWSMGLVGYFQSYALGNLYGGQFRRAMLKAVPNVYSEIAKGNFAPLNQWMTENIHQHGRVYSPDEMLRRVTGEELQSKYFLDYLKEKYSQIYQFDLE